MSEHEEMVFDIRAEGVEDVRKQYKKVEDQLKLVMTATYGILSLFRRMNLPEDVIEVIMFLKQLIATINMLRIAITALFMASGPWGWAMAGIGLAGTAITISEQIAYGMRE